MIYNQGIKNSITVFTSAAAAVSYLAANPDFAEDTFNTYKVVENVDGKAVIEIIDEDGFKLGVL